MFAHGQIEIQCLRDKSRFHLFTKKTEKKLAEEFDMREDNILSTPLHPGLKIPPFFCVPHDIMFDKCRNLLENFSL